MNIKSIIVLLLITMSIILSNQAIPKFVIDKSDNINLERLRKEKSIVINPIYKFNSKIFVIYN